MSGMVIRLCGEWYEALRFLTPLPLPGMPVVRGPGAVLWAFPLAGLALGVPLVCLDVLCRTSGLPSLACSVLMVSLLVLLSGGLHLDGLMDTCDGVLGGHTAARRLEIMKDSRVGAFGVIACVCILLLKVTLVDALPDAHRNGLLLLVPLLGRWAIVPAAALFPSARQGGLGAAFRAGVTARGVVAGAAQAMVLAVILAGSGGARAMVACTIGSLLIGTWIWRAVGGLTGDSYGAVVEIQEVVALLVLVLAG